MSGRKASIKDVAKLAGVSSATVSHVLNKTRYVSPEVTHKVKEALKATNYTTSRIAIALRKNKTNTIGVMIPDISNPFFATIVRNIELTLNDHGYNTILSHSSNKCDMEKNHLEMLTTWSIDGLILIPVSFQYDYSWIKCPTVFIDRKPENQEFCGVFTDNYSILKHSTQKLIDKGHDRIGFISGYPHFSTTRERIEGYLEALYENNIEKNDDHILHGNTTPETGYSLMEKLINNTSINSVIIASNRMAIGAMRYILAHQIEIPKRLAVIVFGDYEWSTLTNPPLSCISQPMEEIGIQAAEMLLDKIEQLNQLPDQITLECKLNERQSF